MRRGSHGALGGDRPLTGVSKHLTCWVARSGGSWIWVLPCLSPELGCWWRDRALHGCARDVPKRLGPPCCHGSVNAVVLEAIPVLQTLRLCASQEPLPCMG